MFSKVLKFLVLAAFVVGLVWGYNSLNGYLNKPIVSSDFAYGNGRIEATEVSISPKIGGRVLEIYVKEGDIVAKGQKLARLDTDALDAQLALVKAQVAQARENKNYVLALLEQKENELSLAQKNYDRAKKLYKKNAISLADFEEKETAYKSYLAAQHAAKAQVAQAQRAIEVAKAQANTIQVNIDDSTLYAPMKGRVLYKLAQDGEVVGAGQNVLVLLNLLDTYMSIFLPTSEAGLIDYGSEARIVLDALPDVAIPAKITFISPKAQFTPKQIETTAERAKLMFRIKANIDTDLLKEHIDKVKTGLPGVAYIPLNKNAKWPEKLNKLPKNYIEQ